MGGYLQSYGAGEEERIRLVKRIVLVLLAIIILAIVAYFVMKDHAEKVKAGQFLADVNAHRYEQAYRDWGCTPSTPCPAYTYQQFLEDWGPSKTEAPWKISATDSCRDFFTVDVENHGSDMQSIMVERNRAHDMGFAPAPECQEPKWRWGQFFRRIFGRA